MDIPLIIMNNVIVNYLKEYRNSKLGKTGVSITPVHLAALIDESLSRRVVASESRDRARRDFSYGVDRARTSLRAHDDFYAHVSGPAQ